MKVTHISQGGQVQIPAEVRKRWGTRRVMIEDGVSYIRIKPLPDDPIAAARGSLKGKGNRLTSDQIRQITREEDAQLEELKAKRLGWDR